MALGLVAELAPETDPRQVLQLIAIRGRDLIDARTLLVLLEEGKRLVVAAAAGQAGPALGKSVPVETPPAEVAAQLGLAAPDALVVPMEFRNRLYGSIVAYPGPGAVFDEDDERAARSFAMAAAAALHMARTVEAEKLKRALEATEQERRRWARELHDETLQELGGLSVTLETAAAQPGEEPLRAAVARAMDHTQRSIEGVYALINELRPPALDQLGLRVALEALVDRAGGGGDEISFDFRFETAGAAELEERLPQEMETAIYRLIQEAVTNAVKHAGASRIEIRLSEEGGAVHACVTDDGAGFDLDRGNGGFGLAGMRERAALLGGRVRIESAPGSGTTVRIALPLPSSRR